MALKKIIAADPGQPDGVQIGEEAADKIGFHGKAPVAQAAGANQAVATDAASALVLVNALRAAFVANGLIKGSA